MGIITPAERSITVYKKVIKTIMVTLLAFSVTYTYASSKVPDIINITYGQDVQLRSESFISLQPIKETAPSRPMSTDNSTVEYTAKLLGIFPLKDVAVVSTEERYVAVSGKPFGIKMFCDGVMVVGFSDILTDNGYRNPAKLAGLKAGDIITAIDNLSTKTNEDVEKIISKTNGKAVTITFLREEKQFESPEALKIQIEKDIKAAKNY